MRRLEDFRIFYNHTIHPELLRLERKRKRLLFLLSTSILLLSAAILVQFYVNVLVVTLLLLIPIGVYITYVLYRIQRFRSTFKPHVVDLILDFIDDGLNFGTLKYDSQRFIAKERFLASQLFATEAEQYIGEDFISGKIGELDFELCELNVKELSRVRTSLSPIFRGVFLHTVLNASLSGEIIVLPRELKPYHSRSIKAFNSRGGNQIEDGLNDSFKKSFMTFRTKDASLASVLTKDMQDTILKYRLESQKEIYVSFIQNEIYIGISEPKDILEPFIFRSNVNFGLVREFFEDIDLLLDIVEKFDQTL